MEKSHSEASPAISKEWGEGEIVTVGIGRRANKWKVGSHLGGGNFGDIHEVELMDNGDIQHDGHKYVIKIGKPEGDLENEITFYRTIATEGKMKRFKDEESRQLKTLGIPKLVASGTHIYSGQSFPFLIIPRFCEDLDQFIKKQGKEIGVKTIIKVALETLAAVEFMHEKGWVHNDIKPKNILLSHSSEMGVYLCDFGVSTKYTKNGKINNEISSNGKEWRGTPGYMPRDAHNGCLSRRGDMEALVYLIIKLLAGSLPWNEDEVYNIIHANTGDVNIPGYLELFKQKEDFVMNPNMDNRYPNKFPGMKVAEEMLKFVQQLGLEDKPNYSELRKLIKKLEIIPTTRLGGVPIKRRQENVAEVVEVKQVLQRSTRKRENEDILLDNENQPPKRCRTTENDKENASRSNLRILIDPINLEQFQKPEVQTSGRYVLSKIFNPAYASGVPQCSRTPQVKPNTATSRFGLPSSLTNESSRQPISLAKKRPASAVDSGANIKRLRREAREDEIPERSTCNTEEQVQRLIDNDNGGNKLAEPKRRQKVCKSQKAKGTAKSETAKAENGQPKEINSNQHSERTLRLRSRTVTIWMTRPIDVDAADVNLKRLRSKTRENKISNRLTSNTAIEVHERNYAESKRCQRVRMNRKAVATTSVISSIARVESETKQKKNERQGSSLPNGNTRTSKRSGRHEQVNTSGDRKGSGGKRRSRISEEGRDTPHH